MIIITIRNTVQRTLVLETVRELTNHPTADEIYASVSRKCPGISKGTVYRDLGVLADSGEILRVNIANAPDRFDLTRYSHTHCLCSACGKLYDYKLKIEPVLDDEANSGFHSEGIDIVVKGICDSCAREKGTL